MVEKTSVSVSFSFDPEKLGPKRSQKAYEAIGAVCAAILTNKEIRKIQGMLAKKQREISITRPEPAKRGRKKA